MDENKELPPIIPLPEGRRIKDMTGEKHGMLECLGFAGKNKMGKVIFKFLCNCGEEFVTLPTSVRNGNTKSCGCLQRASAKTQGESLFKDLSGQTINGIYFNFRVENKGLEPAYNCTCHCGEEFITLGASVKTGRTKSCGCGAFAGMKAYREKNTKSTADFIKDAIAIHGIYYDYSEVVYVNKLTKVKIICPKYGAFWQTPASHLSGSGHPNNKERKGVRAKSDPRANQIIYRISFKMGGETIYKVGLTNSLQTIGGRIRAIKADFKSSNLEIISLYGGELQDCLIVEQFIKSKMKNFTIARPEGHAAGWTECFTRPIPDNLWREATAGLECLK